MVENVIGRVAITQKSPAKPYSFYFWAAHEESYHLEPGTLVTAFHPNDADIYVIAMLEDIESLTASEHPTQEFYASAYGNPDVDYATERPVVRVCRAEIIRRSDGYSEPPLGPWPVRYSTPKEIEEAYSKDIPPLHRLLSGFASDKDKNPVPVYTDARFVLGYEGAHVNISGASGLAAKTSFALFQLFSALALAERNPEYKIGVIAFNVKQDDLLRITQIRPTWEAAEAEMSSYEAKVWQASRNAGVDPLTYLHTHPDKVRMYVPGSSLWEGGIPYSYGFSDLDYGDFAALFDPQDLNEAAEALFSDIFDTRDNDAAWSFERLRQILGFARQAQRAGKQSRQSVNAGQPAPTNVPGLRHQHHPMTISKISNRIGNTVRRLSDILVESDPNGEPIPIGKLRSGDIAVIDIHTVHDAGKRMIFNAVVREVAQCLEEKQRPKVRDSLKNFPDRVLIFVDELNKFAPSGRGNSAIKAQIIEIASRGRSLGLSLIGAQQLASKIDDEVFVNSSTFAVGRSNPVELKSSNYEWLRGDLKTRATLLSKGQLFLWHAVHLRPALVSFPRPLHRLGDK